MITEFNEIDFPNINIKRVTKSLTNRLDKVKCMIEDIQKLKQCHTENKVQLNEDNSKNRKLSPRISPQINLSDKSNEHRDSPKKTVNTDSILQDPEIVALINKNRHRLLKKQHTKFSFVKKPLQ